MQNKAVLTVAAAVSFAVASLAHAQTPPNLGAAQPKAPGSVPAPSPSTLSYLQPTVPAKPAAAPAPSPRPKAAAPAAAAAAAPAKATEKAAVEPAKAKPAPAKPVVRRVRKTTPVPAARAVPALPGTFDLQYSGDIWKALQLVAAKQPQLTILAQGSPFHMPVHLDLRGADLIEALRAIGDQTGDAADLVYNNQTNELRIVYKTRTASAPAAAPEPAASFLPTLGSAAARSEPKTRPGPALSPVDEARAWQKGGTARPIQGQDGLLLFPFGQMQPTLICQPLRACDIQLQEGEIINNVIFGDTVRWIATPATTGSGAQAIPHVIVKPTEDRLETNLMVTTNRRSYMLTLKSSEGQYVSRVGFYYPQEMVQDWNGQAEAERRKAEQDAARTVSEMPIASLDQINLDSYHLKGDRSLPWYPVRVFDDGTHVFIQMPASIKSSEAPAMVLENNGNYELVNFRVKEAKQGGSSVTYYIVDKLFNKGALLVGVGRDQQKVEIIRGARGDSWMSGSN